MPVGDLSIWSATAGIGKEEGHGRKKSRVWRGKDQGNS